MVRVCSIHGSYFIVQIFPVSFCASWYGPFFPQVSGGEGAGRVFRAFHGARAVGMGFV
jgi:hypothetical protein